MPRPRLKGELRIIVQSSPVGGGAGDLAAVASSFHVPGPVAPTPAGKVMAKPAEGPLGSGGCDCRSTTHLSLPAFPQGKCFCSFSSQNEAQSPPQSFIGQVEGWTLHVHLWLLGKGPDVC